MNSERPIHPIRAAARRFGNLLLAGLAAIIPIVVTLWVLSTAYTFINETAAPLYRKMGWDIPGLGVLTVVAVLLAAGFTATNMLGRRLLLAFDRVVLSVPFVSSVYGAVKQALDSIRTLRGGAGKFQRVAYVQLPGSNALLVGFVTGQYFDAALNRELTLFFLPFCPNPVSGRIVAVDSADLIPSSLTVEQVMKMVLSAGLVAPPRNEIPSVVK